MSDGLPGSPGWARAVSADSFPQVGPSALANGDSVPSIPDGLELPASILAHVTPVAHQGPQIWLFSVQTVQVLYGSPAYPINILPILGDYR